MRHLIRRCDNLRSTEQATWLASQLVFSEVETCVLQSLHLQRAKGKDTVHRSQEVTV